MGGMRTDQFDFHLPDDRIALEPARPRDAARLLVCSAHGPFQDLGVLDLAGLLSAGDLLVVNDTKVIPAALSGFRPSRGAGGDVPIEANLAQRIDEARWRAFAKPGKRVRVGDIVRFHADLSAFVEAKEPDGAIVLRFDEAGAALDAALEAAGKTPLPPYVLAQRERAASDEADYQTIFAANPGAVAAPTAGLHFTPAMLAALEAKGVKRAAVTLHVGAGTFLPVKADDTDDHVMHAEWRRIPSETIEAIARARQEGKRVIAIGTTALRALESAADELGRLAPIAGETRLFITPGYRFRVVDALWTNFHLPRSTLFMLVAAFAGLERAQAAYRHAIESGYRFYSFGDACLFERAA
jgi:S-adenosylmethionine:tRNA ribosyltransferase-isomerase